VLQRRVLFSAALDLLAEPRFYLATSLFCLATSLFCLATSLFYLATSLFCLATSLFCLATSLSVSAGLPSRAAKRCASLDGRRFQATERRFS